MIVNCHTHDNPYINLPSRRVTVDLGLQIADQLFDVLETAQTGVGLAANQIGIDAAVAVVKIRKPIILINPIVVDSWGTVLFNEGCLSYPGTYINTNRSKNIIIQTEQEESDWYFSGESISFDGKGSWEEVQDNKNDQEMRLLETVCIQHEIDHINGKCILEFKKEPITSIKHGRNDPCPCGSNKKFKKCCK